MADTDTQDQATATPAQAPADPDLITKYLALLNQPPPNIQPDQTPVDDSGFWGGYRHVVGILGEALGGGKDSPGYEALSPVQRQAAGMNALRNFGTSLMAASHYDPGQTVFSNLAQGFQGAQRSYRGAEQDAAGMLAARQSYAQQQQQDQLARIKEAIPLLTLKQQQAAADAARRIALGNPLAPGTSVATGGSVGASATVPPEYLPYYQEASARTGIPVDVLIAQGHQESGFDPGAVGKSGEIGLHQILPSTAKSPGFGMTGIDPATLRDPRTNINFAADYLKARGGPRTDFSNPATVDAALKNYNGGGDPNYVANVNRYRPTALASIAGAPRPGQTAPPGQVAPPAPVGQNPNAKVPIPPPPVVVAGPGAGTAPDAPPPGPGATPPPPAAPWLPGQVGPGGGGILAPPPAGQAAPDATPPAVAPVPGQPPPTSPVTPPPPDLSTFRSVPGPLPDSPIYNPNLTPAEIAARTKQSQIEAAGLPTPDALAKIQGDIAAAQTAKRAAAEKAIEDYRSAETTRQFEAAKLAAAERDKIAAEQRAAAQKETEAQAQQQRAIQLKEVEAEQSRLSNVQASTNARNEKMLTQLDGEANAARGAISDLDGLKALSDNVKNPSVWATIPWGDTTALNRMAQAGLVDKGEAGATQMLQTGISGVIKSLRQGMSMGSLSDRDLTFIQGMGPNLYQDQDTRSAVIAYLKQAQQAKIRFNVEVNKEMTRPGTNMADAIDRAQQKLPDIVPAIPQDLWSHWRDPTFAQQRIEWAQENGVGKGTLVRKPNGGLELLK